ncbi:IS4 family transposase [Schlesneria sp. T3-172]|uniref:IS4 family transposase n=1 Tax=Schlesneria sphaerica TaxID=3373610 RepID=UPI0037C8301A
MPEMILDQLDTAQFGDKRLTKRFVRIMERVSEKPNMSIPAAMKGRAEMEGAYRFCDNRKVSPEAIRSPHVAATYERIRQTDVVVLVQDTTQLDVTRPRQQVRESGPLEFKTRFGAFVHPLIAFDTNGIPLGETWNKTWVRKSIETQVPRSEKRDRRMATPIEDKESFRWLEGLRAAREVAKVCPDTQCICVGDSEADIYELFAEPRNTGEGQELQLLVRACHDNRVLSNHPKNLVETLRASPSLLSCSVKVSRRTPKVKANKRKRTLERDARVAAVEIRTATVTLRPPHRPDRKLLEATLNVVLIEEPSPPEGQQPIQWILLTTLPIDNLEQVQLIVKYYGIRWQIEVYFKTLKSGCRIEERYFEEMDRLLNCVAVYSIVAWKILYLCRLSQQCPDLDCEVVFEPCEWKPVYMVTHNNVLPQSPPTLNEMVRMIASLGGYVMRSKTQPGSQTLWLGLQRLHDLSQAWNSFGPEASARMPRGGDQLCNDGPSRGSDRGRGRV